MLRFRYILRAVIVLFMQVMLLDLVECMGVCHPYVYILILMMMPIRLRVSADMLIGAALGLLIDWYSNSPGVHMAACVLICAVRRWAIPHLVFAPERLKGEISAATIGGEAMMRLIVLLTVLHHLVVFMLTAWSWASFGWTVLTTVVSSAVTIVVVAAFNIISQNRRQE